MLPRDEPIRNHVQDVKVGHGRVIETRRIHQDYMSPDHLIPEFSRSNPICVRSQPMAYLAGVTPTRRAYELQTTCVNKLLATLVGYLTVLFPEPVGPMTLANITLGVSL